MVNFKCWYKYSLKLDNIQEFLKLIQIHKGENFTLKIKNYNRISSPKNVYLMPFKREIVYEYTQFLLKKNNYMKSPQTSILKKPESAFVHGIQYGSTSNKENIFDTLVNVANVYNLLNTKDMNLTSIGTLLINDRLTCDNIIQLLIKFSIVDNYLLETVIKILCKYSTINNYAIGFIFGASHNNTILDVYHAINAYQSSIMYSCHHLSKKSQRRLFQNIWNLYFPRVTSAQLSAITNNYTKNIIHMLYLAKLILPLSNSIEINPINKYKLHALLRQLPLQSQVNINCEHLLRKSTTSIELPWHSKSLDVPLLIDKVNSISNVCSSTYVCELKHDIKTGNVKTRQKIDDNINKLYIKGKLIYFLKYSSRQPSTRNHILQRFDAILQNDLPKAPMWLEENTYLSLACIGNSYHASRNILWNGKMDVNGTPVDYASNHSSDIILKSSDLNLNIEVTLMKYDGQRQHEIPSIIKHTRYLWKNSNKYTDGLFIAPIIDNQSIEALYLIAHVNEAPVYILPLTVYQYVFLVNKCYVSNLSIQDFCSYIHYLCLLVLKSSTYSAWRMNINNHVYHDNLKTFLSHDIKHSIA